MRNIGMVLGVVLAIGACGDSTSPAPPQSDMTASVDSATPADATMGGADMTATGGDAATTGDMTQTTAADMTHATDGATGAKTVDVTVGGGGFTFSPSSVTIHVGDTVKWTWAGNGHTVTSGTSCVADNKFCEDTNTNCAASPLQSAGHTYSHTFTGAGTFPYFCLPHCSLGMTGTVTVQ